MHHKSLTALLLFFSLLLPFNKLMAQADTTQVPDSLKARKFFLSNLQYSDSVFKDTTFKEFKAFDFVNQYPSAFTGNHGGARYSPLLSLDRTQPHINQGYIKYFHNHDNIAYYSAPNPHSTLTFINGARREQFFNVLHTQNFGESLNVKFDLTKRGSDGFYNRLRTNHSLFNFSTNFQSRKGNYGFLAHYYTNRINAQENGGFENFNTIDNPELSGTTNLENSINRVVDNNYFIKQYFRLGKTDKYYDKDSILHKDFDPYVQISYTFKYGKMQKWYEDNLVDRTAYPNTFFNSITTFDSISQISYNNEFTLSALNGKFPFVGAIGGHEFLDHDQTSRVDTSFNNYYAGGFLTIKYQRFTWHSVAKFYLQGYNAEDLMINTSLKGRIKRDSVRSNIHYHASADFQLREPEYYLTNYRSNHFVWRNDFNKTGTLKLQAQLEYNGFKLMASIVNFSNYIYFNEDITPVQTAQELQYTALTGFKDLNFGHFTLENQLSFQTSSDERILPLPQLIVQETFYYQNFLFKRALSTRIGFTVNYYTEHFGYDYMPALSQFHLQSAADRVSVGDYPMLDVFVDMKIKRMKIFFMMSHVNQGISGENFFRIPNYPLPGRAFRFGLNWNFFD